MTTRQQSNPLIGLLLMVAIPFAMLAFLKWSVDTGALNAFSEWIVSHLPGQPD